MIKSISENFYPSSSMLDLIVEYYNATYEMLKFQKLFEGGVEDSIIIQIAINKFR